MTESQIYEPREDSELLAKWVAKLSFGSVLDMGCGTAYQAQAAKKNKKTKSILCVDKNPLAIRHAKQLGFKAIQSDLFVGVKETYDTIIFNPPYLPADPKYPDMALDGGKKGYEILARFLRDLPNHMKTKGCALVLFSSLTQKHIVDQVIDDMLLHAKELEKAYIGGFETLYVYKLTKTDLVQQLERKNILYVRRLTKGHRGLIFIGKFKRRKVAIKVQRPDSPAKGTVNHEANILAKLNKKQIGPRVAMSGKDFFVYPFVEGIFMKEYLEKTNKKYAIIMLHNVFKQMRVLDKFGHNKEEMHHPYKHVIVGKSGKITLLDFERCHAAIKVHNVTQFCQCVSSKAMEHMLTPLKIRIDKKNMIAAAKMYKNDMSEKNYKAILSLVK